jgi:uncharacterized protein (DUF488 family)
MRCLNLGYQGRSLKDFCNALAANCVKVLIDVRLNAWSQRPEFRKASLQSALAERGIEYIHYKEAGNPYRPKNGETLAFDECARQYAQYIEDNPKVIDTLEAIITEHLSALLCYEAERSECHRSILIDALMKRRKEIKVIDL